MRTFTLYELPDFFTTQAQPIAASLPDGSWVSLQDLLDDIQVRLKALEEAQKKDEPK